MPHRGPPHGRGGPGRHGPRHRGQRRKRWGLRRRLTFTFAFVALAAVGLTTWLTLGAVFEAQQALFEAAPGTRDGFRQEGWPPWQGGWHDPEAEPVMAAFRQIPRTAFLAALISFFLAAGAAAFVTRRLTRPLDALTSGARRLAAGERGLRLRLPAAKDELRVLTEAFNNMVEGLERQETWRRALVADVAHDLRTPLAVMRSEIEAMQDGLVSLDDEGLARLHAEVMMLSRLVDDLRTLSLTESGGLTLKLEPTPVKPLLKETLEAFASRAQEVGVVLELDNTPGDLVATLDRDRIRQLLRNLLDNALRYASPGCVELGADEEGAEAENAAGLRLWLRDHGPGLPPEAIERVFERFFRGDLSRTRQRDAGGSGLGLAIAKAIAEAHGGRLEAANHPDGGAVFTLYLPGTDSI